MQIRRALLGGCVVMTAAIGIAHGHADDPKERDREPRYEGPGYRNGAFQGPTTRGGSGFESLNVNLRAWLPIGDFGSFSSANDCWGYTAPSGREYAIIGLSSATGFVEVTNPDNPQIIAVESGPTSTWRDVKTYNQTAYVVSEGGSGIQVFDLARIDQGMITPHPEVTSGGTTATHNVAIDTDSGFLYRCGGDTNGLRIYDLSSRLTPSLVASWSERYVHDAQIKTFTTGPNAGKQIAFCCSGFGNGGIETGIDILDVTDKQNIQLLARYQYPFGAYSHQAWLTEDAQYLLLNDELDEPNLGVTSRTIVIDVSDVANPQFAGSWGNNNPAITHNLYVRGDLMYAANYRSGLRIFDISDPTNGVETAYFDTYPNSDSASFNGLWSVYPYFPSGTVIGSDIERGLFVWTPGTPTLSVNYPNGVPTMLAPAGQTLTVTFDESQPGDLNPASPTLHFDNGSGVTSVPMSLVSGTTFEASFGALDCFDVLNFYVSAEDQGGLPFVDPPGAPSGGGYVAAVVTGLATTFSDDMESSTGWIVGAPGDTASTGIWTRVDPNGTGAQPEDDHTPGAGTQAWVTGQGSVGGSLGENDIDGGATTLTSPVLDATAQPGEAYLIYHRWYSNNTGAAPNADSMPIQISNGGPWVQIESVTENAGSWVFKKVRIADFVTPTSQVQVRFIASDLSDPSVVEAGVDDVSLEFVECEIPSDLAGDFNDDCIVDINDLNIVLGNFGSVYTIRELNQVIGNFGSTCPL